MGLCLAQECLVVASFACEKIQKQKETSQKGLPRGTTGPEIAVVGIGQHCRQTALWLFGGTGRCDWHIGIGDGRTLPNPSVGSRTDSARFVASSDVASQTRHGTVAHEVTVQTPQIASRWHYGHLDIVAGPGFGREFFSPHHETCPAGGDWVGTVRPDPRRVRFAQILGHGQPGPIGRSLPCRHDGRRYQCRTHPTQHS